MRIAATLIVFFLSGPPLVVQAALPPSNPVSRLERTNLLIYKNARGEILPVKSVRDWQKRRATILQAMQEVMGPLPGKEKRCPLDVRVEEETDCGSYLRRF